jgi:hypothetical protein
VRKYSPREVLGVPTLRVLGLGIGRGKYQLVEKMEQQLARIKCSPKIESSCGNSEKGNKSRRTLRNSWRFRFRAVSVRLLQDTTKKISNTVDGGLEPSRLAEKVESLLPFGNNP